MEQGPELCFVGLADAAHKANVRMKPTLNTLLLLEPALRPFTNPFDASAGFDFDPGTIAELAEKLFAVLPAQAVFGYISQTQPRHNVT